MNYSKFRVLDLKHGQQIQQRFLPSFMFQLQCDLATNQQVFHDKTAANKGVYNSTWNGTPDETSAIKNNNHQFLQTKLKTQLVFGD